jgi:hypothetical protein
MAWQPGEQVQGDEREGVAIIEGWQAADQLKRLKG